MTSFKSNITLDEIVETLDKASRFWHPGPYEMDLQSRLTYFALALGGESGELLNFVKKQIRDGSNHTTDIMLEIADVFVYLTLVANTLGIRLQDAIECKYKINVNRWGAVPE